MIDEDLLAAARRAARRAGDAARAADVAKADYHHAIRHLHLAGATMREIATALDLSHQRVQQIVDAQGGGRSWRRRRPPSEGLACTFCGAPCRKSRQLVAGPGIYICRRCIAEARRLIETGTSTQLVLVGERGSCGFCGKCGGHVTALVAPATEPARLPARRKYDAVAICNGCLQLCEEIVDQPAR